MANDYGIALFPQHAALLRASAISPDVARQRNYQSVDTKARLESIDIPKSHRLVPGLLIPVYGPESTNGEAATWQYRPDHPKLDAKGKPVKYVTAMRGMVVDVPPAVRSVLGDPERSLWITEGIRKVDSAVSHGIDCIGVLGVWNWRGGNTAGGTTALGAWEHIALNGRDILICFDSDVMVKESVRKALYRFCGFLEYRKASVRLVMLPDNNGDKVGLDDYLANGGTIDELEDAGRIIWPSELNAFTRNGAQPKPEPYVPPVARTLAETQQAFKKWLRLDDMVPVLVVAGTMAANLATGRPVWLLVVAPASSGKTEIAGTVRDLPYVHVVSELTKSALLSGTASRDRSRDATGGLMCQVGKFGVLLAKDFTSVLTQNKDARGEALSALREIADGYWVRPLGADGGRVLEWSGKCGFIGCVTPAIDRYHAVLSALGDRYLVVRLPSDDAPTQTALRALSQNSRESNMHRELSDAMCGLVVGADLDQVNRPLTDDETDALIRLAVFTARARTGVDRDGYSHEVLYLPQPEGPGRLVNGMRRLFGGLEAIGCDPNTAWNLIARVAVDCMPAARIRLVRELLDPERDGERTRTSELAEAVGMATKTAHRQLEDMALLGLAVRTKTSTADNAPDMWEPSVWLREQSGTDILSQHLVKLKKDGNNPPKTDTEHGVFKCESPHPESRSHSDEPPAWDWS